MAVLERIRIFVKDTRTRLFPGHAPTIDVSNPDACQRCGGSYEASWRAPDTLWERVHGDNDRLCMDCFDVLARQMGKFLLWTPERVMEEGGVWADRIERAR